MPRFKLGDRVYREDRPEPNYISTGTITAVIPNQHGLDIFCEYEVDFGIAGVLLAYETQLWANNTAV